MKTSTTCILAVLAMLVFTGPALATARPLTPWEKCHFAKFSGEQPPEWCVCSGPFEPSPPRFKPRGKYGEYSEKNKYDD